MFFIQPPFAFLFLVSIADVSSNTLLSLPPPAISSSQISSINPRISVLKNENDPNYHHEGMAFPNFRKASTKAHTYFPHTQPAPNISDEWIRLSTGEFVSTAFLLQYQFWTPDHHLQPAYHILLTLRLNQIAILTQMSTSGLTKVSATHVICLRFPPTFSQQPLPLPPLLNPNPQFPAQSTGSQLFV